MALSDVMLFNSREAIVIDACCGETHRHTMKKTRERHHTIHDACSVVRSGELRLYPLQCWVCHGVASGDAF